MANPEMPAPMIPIFAAFPIAGVRLIDDRAN